MDNFTINQFKLIKWEKLKWGAYESVEYIVGDSRQKLQTIPGLFTRIGVNRSKYTTFAK